MEDESDVIPAASDTQGNGSRPMQSINVNPKTRSRQKQINQGDTGDIGGTVSYKDLGKRMSWKDIDQIDNSIKSIPIWSLSPPFISKLLSPVDYFRQFFDKEVLLHIVNQSNLFSCQRDVNKPLVLEIDELEQFLGICMYMSLIRLPRTRYYWSPLFQIPAVSDYMPMRRWEIIKNSLHFSDNEQAIPKGQPGYDALYKIRSLVDLLNIRYNDVEVPENCSVDEQMIPYSGKNGPRICEC